MANEATVASVVNAVQENVNAPVAVAPQAPAAPDPREEIWAKKERAFRQQQKQFQSERDALKAKMAEYETGYVPKSRLKEDAWSVLNEAGVDYNKLTEDLLNQPNMNDPATRAMMSKLKALEDKQAAIERQAQESQTAQFEQAKAAIANEASMLIDSDPKFETIKAEGMTDAVTDLIIETFKTEGRLMDVTEAAEQVETYLVDTFTKGASYSKVQSKLQPKAPEVTSAPVPQKQQTAKITTLTNNIVPSERPSKGRSEKERIARAMAAFRGEIK